ncbi:hypothetical protein GCM10007276_07760 [Agaricicola taiwanensis]|uniref:Autotransporter domain-containing protein n=1 Tax=Agaricicola taiwanensis TaxID=591372 RepID=A0A8J2YD70_9RHOB|nr:autotransporter outer membrane beta-barrel domain-containing protein [Agaricicola taiwanensis]GGE32955.1 hypothetical protein GCM10007276_07760 [Agaricicola taiwanensis]
MVFASQQALAASYTASTEQELRDRIADANADADPTATITLTGNIAISDPAAFPALTKPVTIDAGAFTLSGPDVAVGAANGSPLSFSGGSMVLTGTFEGGNAASANSNGSGGSAISLTGGSIDNSAAVTGGAGGSTSLTSPAGRIAGVGGSGMSLTDSVLVNGAAGSITGGQGGYTDSLGNSGSGTNLGGGAGGAGLIMTGGSLDNQGTITGGDGGDILNSPGNADNHFAGAGGVGAFLTGGTHANSGTITGGQGGIGRNIGGIGSGLGGTGLALAGGGTFVNNGAIIGGDGNIETNTTRGGSGGLGATAANSTLENFGTITGGNAGGTTGGVGGIGISGTGGAKIVNGGMVDGGLASNGVQNAIAIQLTNGGNTLELRAGSTINGLVTATATDTLALGGTTNETFNTALIASNQTYRGFGRYQKIGSSTWTLTGTTAAVTPWEIVDGMLSVAQDSNLGALSGRLTFSGGTLENTAAFTTSRAMTINAAGGTFKTDADLTLSGMIDGAGGLTKTGTGKLTLTGTNTYAGGTLIDDGTISVAADANLGNAAGALVFDGGTLENTAAFTSNRAVGLNAGGGTFDTGANLTLNGVISGIGGLDKTGLGTLILNGNNDYAGATTISAGTLLVNGDQSAADGLTTTGSGATLGGSGTVGGDVIIDDGGILSPGASNTQADTLTIDGDLTLSGGSILDFNFGQSNIEGGAFNDLVNVNGDLTLDGTLNVTTTPGGTFDTGIYRVINYSGDIIANNILELGSPSPTLYVQTSIDHQVNLVNTSGLALRYWDGDAGPKNDGTPDGGNGIWQDFSGNDNWVDPDNVPNAGFLDSAFAIFMGTAGTIEVDDSPGAVNASGMQFMTDGYRIEGDALNLVGATWSDIRVGDGTAGGTTMTATIASELTGASGLNKTDAGTLVLTAANSYTGGTRISGGTLQISEDANLGLGSVEFDGGTLRTTSNFTTTRALTASAGGGAINTDAATSLTLAGVLTGAGSLDKIGVGTVLQQSASLQTGTTTIRQGIWRTGGANVLSAVGGYAVAAGGTLDLDGLDQTVGGFDAGGAVRFGGAPGTTLTVNGDYAGSGGTLYMNTTLDGDGSSTDRLVVTGNSTGNSNIHVTNVGGSGAPTAEGIKLVDVGGASTGTFALRGDYVFEGDQAVVSGAYAYRLHQGGVSTPADGDWYLRSALVAPDGSAGHLYQPGVPLYESYARVLQRFNTLDSLHQRVGNRSWMGAAPGGETGAIEGNGIWGRVVASHAHFEPEHSTSGASFNADTWKMQFGADRLLHESGAGRLIGALSARYGLVSAQIESPSGDGDIDTTGYGLGGTLTWYGASGFYVDTQAEATWYSSDLASDTARLSLADGNDGFGYGFSLESGQRIALDPHWSLTPQAQLAYSTIDFDSFTDAFGARVSSERGGSLVSRLGLAANYDNEWRNGAGQLARSSVYGIANLYYEFLDGSRTKVAAIDFTQESEPLWGGLGLGGSYNWADNKYSVYGEVGLNTSLAAIGDSYSVNGTAGFRARF